MKPTYLTSSLAGLALVVGCGQVEEIVHDAGETADAPDATGSDAAAPDAHAGCDDGFTGEDCGRCTVFVDGAEGDDDDAGQSWSEPLATVQAGIDLASARRTSESHDACDVWVRAGTYVPGAERSDSFVLTPGVDLYGGFAGDESARSQRDWHEYETILSGDIEQNDDPDDDDTLQDNAYRVVIGADDSRLDGFTVKAGAAQGDDEESRGGGLYNDSASPTIANTVFYRNSADRGGAVYNANESAPVITETRFSNNSARTQGGALHNRDSAPYIESATFAENTAVSVGGAVRNVRGELALVNAEFFRNQAGSEGGAVFNTGEESELVITNATFTDNVAEVGGAISTSNSISGLRVRNTILWENVGTVEDSEIHFLSGEILIRHSIVQGGRPDGVQEDDFVSSLDENPLFVEAEATEPNLQLLADSPAINAGNSGLAVLEGVDHDLAGNPRVVGDDIDIGAYEFQSE